MSGGSVCPWRTEGNERSGASVSVRRLCEYLLPTMRDAWLRPLMQRFSQMRLEQPLFADVFGPV